MPIVIVVGGILLLLVLIMKAKLNTFVSLIIVSFVVALALGLPFDKIVKSIEGGIGGTLGHIALIFGLGAMLGRLIADAGGAQRIAVTLIEKFGEKNVQWAVVASSFIIGIALFFEVGLVLLIPIVLTMARQMKISALHLGVPMWAALLATHAFLPPHPGPTVIAGEYGADIGKVLVYGIIIAIPSVIIGGPIYNMIAKKLVPAGFAKVPDIDAIGGKAMDISATPGFGVSVFTAMLPVLMMMAAAIIAVLRQSYGIADNMGFAVIRLVGDASVAMVISLLVAIWTMGLNRAIPIKEIMVSCQTAVAHIGMMLLIIGGGGAFKQVLIDGGVGKYVAQIFANSNASPLLFAWSVAALLRVSLGSATVAAISTAGLVIPMLQANPGHINLALITLATGAGSAICSHVNDAGFWMCKEYFGLTMKETFATWTVLSTIVSVCGLIGVLALESFGF